MRRGRIGLALGVPLLLLALGGAAGCNRGAAGDGVATASGNGGGAPSTSESPSVSDDEARRNFAQCMRDNGVPDFPDPDPNQSGGAGIRIQVNEGNRDTMQSAMQACRSKLPNGGERPQLDAAQLEQLREWAQCMRDNGVDVPDPDPDGGGFVFGGGSGERSIGLNDPAFQKAMEACQDKFTFGGGPRVTTGSGS